MGAFIYNEQMNEGIVLFAFGDATYMHWAESQAVSIKANSDLPIQLIHDENIIKHKNSKLNVFDITTQVDHDIVYKTFNIRGREVERLTPGEAKLSVYNLYAFEENIILDVDGITFKDLRDLFKLCSEQGGSYYSQYQGEGGYQDAEWSDMIWAKAPQLYEYYGLSKDFTFPFINSSFQYVKKNPETKELFDIAYDMIRNNPLPRHLHYRPWGVGQPDELYMNLALGMTGISPKLLALPRPYHFSVIVHAMPKKEQIYKENFGFGLWGGKGLNHKMLLEWYDALMQGYYRERGMPHVHKAHKLIKSKFVHQK